MRRLQIRSGLAVVLFAVLLCLPVLDAQTSKGILVGVVRDGTGAVLPGAQVTVNNQDTAETRKTTTDSEGAYRVDGINPGTYEVDITMEGFIPFRSRGNIVNPSVVSAANAELTIGGTTSVIEVTAGTNATKNNHGQ